MGIFNLHLSMCHFRLMVLGLCGLLTCCCCSGDQSASVAGPSDSNRTSSDKRQGLLDQRYENRDLSTPVIAALRVKYDIARFFAWDGSDAEGNVMWIDSHNRLWRGYFERGATGYHVSSALDNPNSPNFRGPDGELADTVQLAPLAPYLSDAEFPVHVDTIEAGNFRAHIALVWLAKRRSFHSDASTKIDAHGSDPDIALAGVRAVVTKNDDLVSNSIYEIRLSQPNPRKVLLEDLTDDGIKEYAYYERHMTEFVYVWSVSVSGSFQPLRLFQIRDPDQLSNWRV